MNSTRQLIVHVLEHDAKIRDWCMQKHRFSLEKAKSANLADYGDIVAVIIADGMKSGAISEAQVEGAEPLSA